MFECTEKTILAIVAVWGIITFMLIGWWMNERWARKEAKRDAQYWRDRFRDADQQNHAIIMKLAEKAVEKADGED